MVMLSVKIKANQLTAKNAIHNETVHENIRL